MRAWQAHSDLLLKGEWHVHTSLTDGEGTVDEYCRRAQALGLPLIAFTEHVRLDLKYDFNSFLDSIDNAREEYDIIILSGCEAKVLPGGELDVEDWILDEVDHPIFAFHAFPDDQELYFKSLLKAIRSKAVAWAHPGALLKHLSYHLDDDELEWIFRSMAEREVLLELNSKYDVPPEDWRNLASSLGVKFVRGGDIHSPDALRRY
jgi:putative hydrolase